MEDGEDLAGREDAKAWRRESRFMGVELVKLVVWEKRMQRLRGSAGGG